jgi:proteasome accessory factor A
MLANGARYYIDHAHPEYATPECHSIKTLVAADKAGELLLERCLHAASRGGAPIRLYKNNSDHKGVSWGCHENYCITAELFEELVYTASPRLSQLVLPFLVTRTIFCGAGKVGGELEAGPAGFQLSQRADFIETLTGPQTTYLRPLFNQRDEAHADERRVRRLHMIAGDANMAEFSTYLKFGITRIFLRMLGDGFIGADLALADPVAGMRTVSRDLTFQAQLPLRNGNFRSAVDIQEQIAGFAERYLDDRGGSEEEWDVLDNWLDAIEALRTDWRKLSGSLDWAIKRSLLERYLAAQNSSWDQVADWQPIVETALRRQNGVPESLTANVRAADLADQRDIYFALRRMDLEYHDIRRGPGEAETGLFYRLQDRGAVSRVVTDAEIAHLVNNPPTGSRASWRGALIASYPNSIYSADWSCVSVATRHGRRLIRFNEVGTEAASMGETLCSSAESQTKCGG